MNVTLRFLGVEVFHFSTDTDADSSTPEPDPRDLSGGTTAATPMGFVPRMDAPHEIETPDRDW